jgi:hypothetical protein
VATLNEKDQVTLGQVEEMEDCERSRRQQITSSLASADPFVQQLALEADSFDIMRADGASSVIAGYHWFTDWGRDTMISLPGLTLTTGRNPYERDSAYHHRTVWAWLIGPFVDAYLTVFGGDGGELQPRNRYSMVSENICPRPCWDRSRKFSMPTLRMPRKAAQRKPGAWPEVLRALQKLRFLREGLQ